MGLPFLVVYGAWVWKFAIVVVILVMFGIGYLRRRAKARAAYAETLAGLRAGLSSPQRGPVTLLGIVTSPTTMRSDGVDIDVTPAMTFPVNEEVIATGMLTELPPEHASYREGTPRWNLESHAAYATKLDAKPEPLSKAGIIGRTIVIGTATLIVMAITGAALEPDSLEREHRSDGVLPAFGRHELGAALPGSRKLALRRIASSLGEYPHPQSRLAFGELVRVDQLRDQCAVDTFRGVADYEGGLAEAKRCGTPADQAQMLFFLGRFAEAKAIVPPEADGDLQISIAVANADWAHAAELADHYLDLTHESIYYNSQEDQATYHCYAALMRQNAGDATAFSKVTPGHDAPCAIIEAAGRPVAEQPGAWAVLQIPRTNAGGRSSRYDLGAGELARAAGPIDDHLYGAYSKATLALMFNSDFEWVLLAPFTLAAHPADKWTGGAEADMASYETLRGNLAAAHAHLEKVGDEYIRPELAEAIALREGAPLADNAHSEYRDVIEIRNGKVPADSGSIFVHDANPEDLRAVAAGDGRVLARLLTDKLAFFDSGMHFVMGVIPMLKSGKPEMMEALHFYRSFETYSIERLRPLADACTYRDFARLIGDTAEQQRWQAVVDRWFAMLQDRQKLVALLLWG
ncbi:MAG: hypothetical protein QM831_28575 [Kofleriaceae bacterium]